ISDSYLRWQGIEATLQLAQSSNSKIVIVGSGKDGLPIILGNADAAASPQSGNEESAPKERTTTATPATTAEKVPADTLLKPSPGQGGP
ncbi:MAG: prohibitin family protein, partial [Xanthobacteraceae bacterium]